MPGYVAIIGTAERHSSDYGVVTGATFQPRKTRAESVRGSNQTYADPFAWRAVARSGTGLDRYSHLDRVSRP
jgi:hypothetical protein